MDKTNEHIAMGVAWNTIIGNVILFAYMLSIVWYMLIPILPRQIAKQNQNTQFKPTELCVFSLQTWFYL